MPRPGIGNPGNKGGKPYSKENREKAATLKGLVLDWALDVMKNKDKYTPQERKLIIEKILPTCVPRSVEVTGEEGKPIPIIIEK